LHKQFRVAARIADAVLRQEYASEFDSQRSVDIRAARKGSLTMPEAMVSRMRRIVARSVSIK